MGITLLQKGVYNDNHMILADYVKRMQTNWTDTTSKDHLKLKVVMVIWYGSVHQRILI
jgi:hypothetical protein